MRGYTYRFYKTIEERWFIEIPDWEGPPEELELVLGADIMLNYMAGYNDTMWIFISEYYFEKSTELKLIGKNTEIGSGADYMVGQFQGIDLKLKIWLCDVVLFIFDKFPKNIYISLQE